MLNKFWIIQKSWNGKLKNSFRILHNLRNCNKWQLPLKPLFTEIESNSVAAFQIGSMFYKLQGYCYIMGVHFIPSWINFQKYLIFSPFHIQYACCLYLYAHDKWKFVCIDSDEWRQLLEEEKQWILHGTQHQLNSIESIKDRIASE